MPDLSRASRDVVARSWFRIFRVLRGRFRTVLGRRLDDLLVRGARLTEIDRLRRSGLDLDRTSVTRDAWR